MADRKVKDMEQLELDYRTGLRTFKQMSETHGISAPRIVQIAKSEGWTRDLGAKIRQTAMAKLAAPPSPGKLQTEAEIVEQGSNRVVDIVLSHQKDAGRVRQLAMTMLEELELSTRAPMALRELQTIISMHAGGEAIPHDMLARADLALHQVMTLDSRAGTLKSLADTLTKVVAIEREAHNVGAPKPDEPPPGQAGAISASDFEAFRSKFMAAVQRHQQGVIDV